VYSYGRGSNLYLKIMCIQTEIYYKKSKTESSEYSIIPILDRTEKFVEGINMQKSYWVFTSRELALIIIFSSLGAVLRCLLVT